MEKGSDELALLLIALYTTCFRISPIFYWVGFPGYAESDFFHEYCNCLKATPSETASHWFLLGEV